MRTIWIFSNYQNCLICLKSITTNRGMHQLASLLLVADSCVAEDCLVACLVTLVSLVVGLAGAFCFGAVAFANAPAHYFRFFLNWWNRLGVGSPECLLNRHFNMIFALGLDPPGASFIRVTLPSSALTSHHCGGFIFDGFVRDSRCQKFLRRKRELLRPIVTYI